ncbi:hypothetical protein [Bifidobacterium avesanii]|uniref:Uncharacterized protein n=1 Tax=Bifidobacterium avesanii TaxID=1798157 RepID=A0A7K3TI09_9BIFI|nr:hypothetical protein [Bifidobacterium avesanii]KAB8287384.1 hypothetical protein DSM100685_1903 [Bifidobacterium avesanii]NEG78701.1 hypothetical protein [Bifidobacterium avesanii]
MTFAFDNATVARLTALPAVREAAERGSELLGLWPLTEAMHMDNDAKYGENLQVRLTRAAARIMTGQDVTVPDAEFVYEGADSIPGRPQEIVDALLDANDAYDALLDFSDTGDAKLVLDAADKFGAGWSDDVAAAVTGILNDVEAAVQAGAVPGNGADAASVDAVAGRFAAALIVCDALLAAAGDDPRAVLPVLLTVNELREQISVPRIALSDAQVKELLEARKAAGSDAAARLDATAAFVAPLAAAEWKKHREDVLWDPAAAKKQAKEEDEKRNKEALAAKFAHVKDDPNKEHVEL